MQSRKRPVVSRCPLAKEKVALASGKATWVKPAGAAHLALRKLRGLPL